ncbi:MAG TPA: DUF4278 domain-containing protein [Leptolyngbyaceae cyanobacterium M65_K2018_010]|nr:DUF4278 domain-containing protein [Leptolyngbyaceae cyanobacterium M65_K2018_010]
MSLKYRGVNYDVVPAQVAVTEEVIGRYRGAVATRHLAPQIKVSHPKALKYRGAVVRY